MGSVIERPVDSTTIDNLQLGVPYVDFRHALPAGGFGAYFDLGVIQNAELQKSIETIELNDARSGLDELLVELVRKFTGTLQVDLNQHNAANMQLMFASESATAVVADAAKAVTGDTFNITSDERDFIALSNGRIDETTMAVTCATITDESVGTGDGTLGDALGDYSLDYKPLDTVTDVTSVTVAGVAYTPVATGAASTGLEVEIEDYGDDTTNAGRMQFFSAGSAVNVTGAILATYTPGHTFSTLNTDFTVDELAGRVRMLGAGATTDELKASQPMLAAYSYEQLARNDLKPFTQFVFKGSCRIRLLTDRGINIVWEPPSAQARLTDDPFVFSRDEFAATPVAIQLLTDGSSTPYGTLQLYDENAA